MRLENWLASKKMAHAEFARQLGISTPALSGYITGKTEPRLPIAVKIVGLTEGEVYFTDLLKPTGDSKELSSIL